MLIIQAGTPDYAPMMDETLRRCGKWGYRYVRHELQPDAADLGGNLPPCTFKPKTLEGLPADEICAWLDADAIPTRPFADELLGMTRFDVAVTLRDADQIGKSQPTTNYLNAGVIFFQGEATWWFVRKWQCLTDSLGNDQLALNEMVGRGWTEDQWRASFGRTIKAYDGHLVRILPCAIWNYNDFNQPPGPDVRILHFKRGWRELNGPDWWRSVIARYPV